jgi:Domain of unknown function (DUF1905)
VSFTFTAEVWHYEGEAPWHFVTLPADVADEIRARTAGQRPFNTVPVTVTIGAMAWDTSVFADRKTASYLLPLKAEVRDRGQIAAGDRVTVSVELRE